jgi:hypothetical protein
MLYFQGLKKSMPKDTMKNEAMKGAFLSVAAAAAASASHYWMQRCSSDCHCHAQVVAAAVAILHQRTIVGSFSSSQQSALYASEQRSSWDDLDLHDTFMHDSVTTAFTTRDNCTVPGSNHYRQDSREIGKLPPVSDVKDLSELLAQRYQAKRRCNAVQQQQQQQRVDQLDAASPESTSSDESTSTITTIDQTTSYYRAIVAELDAQLRQRHGVRVFDHPPIWSRLLDSPPPAVRRQTAAKRAAVLQRAFGPTRHAYQRVGSAMCATPLGDETLSEIHNLLSRYTLHRLHCSSSSKWPHKSCEMAAALRLELEIHGVRVNDETLQWTTDPWHTFTDASQHNGATFMTWTETTAHSIRSATVPHGNSTLPRSEYTRRLRQRAVSVEWPKYNQDALSLPIAALLPRLNTASSRTVVAALETNADVLDAERCHRLEQRIAQLVWQRWMALQRGETALARSMAWELDRTYLVHVNDSTMTWSIVSSHLVEDSTRPDRQHQDLKPLNANVGQVKAQDLPLSVNPTMFPSVLLFGDDGHDTTTSYRCSSCSQPLPDTILSRVETLIQERIHKREEGKFLEADAIRRELWYTYVRMLHRLLLWRLGFMPDQLFRVFGTITEYWNQR